MVRRGPIDARPERVTGAGASGTNIGVAVVAVDAPGMENSLMIQKLMSRAADVIHDLVAAVFLKRLAHPAAMSSKTSSQLALSHFPSPLFPARFNG